MVAALYGFLGWIIWLLWRDLKSQQNAPVIQPETPLSFVIDIGETKRVQQFSSAEIIIGRDPSCDCAIDSNTVSKHHARLSFDRGQWWVEDLGSTNGTLLNEQPLSVPTVLALGDQLRCGEATLTIEKPAEPPGN